MLPLHTHADVRGVRGVAIRKVLTADEARHATFDLDRCLLWRETDSSSNRTAGIGDWGGGISPGEIPNPPPTGIVVSRLRHPEVVVPGDVVRLTENSSRVSVLYRRGSNSNTLLATERCNSLCLMCSQPPRDVDDSYLVDEMLETILLVDQDEPQLGISGGEPTLLGEDLLVVLHHARRHLPDTGLHVLSNGRRFADPAYAERIAAVRHPSLIWGIPVYSESPEIHDYIVQARGAWTETISGLFNLARVDSDIEIRVVVQRANYERLPELAYFIFRNLTFARHVAFMGIEPIGFAPANRDSLWVDPADCAGPLKEATFFLANRGMNVSLYNFPLCSLPGELWDFARKSISDWKNTYLPECEHCLVQDECCGFFTTIGSRWMSRAVRPISAIGASGAVISSEVSHGY